MKLVLTSLVLKSFHNHNNFTILFNLYINLHKNLKKNVNCEGTSASFFWETGTSASW